MKLIFTLNEIDTAAKQFILLLDNSKILTFSGEMGTGKTTFIHAVCREMGVIDKMSSPTYAIINQYKTINGAIVNHIDLYRLKDIDEAVQAGVEDAINSGDFCFIEWPEKIEIILPSRIVKVSIDIANDNARKLIAKFT
jgi:tRNA threonylcarbamoyladenosine biosynthesis protein TsaE